MKGRRVVLRILRESETVPRVARRQNQSLRDYPTYTIPEAAISLGIPVRTLRYWLLDQPLWDIAGPDPTNPLLSFRDVAQIYYVELVRKYFEVNASTARRVIQEAEKESRAAYPLLGKNIKILFNHIIMDKPARGKQPRRAVDLSHYRQLTFTQLVDEFSTRIHLDRHFEPLQIYPWRHWTGPDDTQQPVSMDPNIMSGRLVITGTRIPVQLVLVRAGKESVPQIANDYDLPESTIHQALEHIVRQEAA